MPLILKTSHQVEIHHNKGAVATDELAHGHAPSPLMCQSWDLEGGGLTTNLYNDYGDSMGKTSCFSSWQTVAAEKRGLIPWANVSGGRFPGGLSAPLLQMGRAADSVMAGDSGNPEPGGERRPVREPTLTSLYPHQRLSPLLPPLPSHRALP